MGGRSEMAGEWRGASLRIAVVIRPTRAKHTLCSVAPMLFRWILAGCMTDLHESSAARGHEAQTDIVTVAHSAWAECTWAFAQHERELMLHGLQHVAKTEVGHVLRWDMRKCSDNRAPTAPAQRGNGIVKHATACLRRLPESGGQFRTDRQAVRGRMAPCPTRALGRFQLSPTCLEGLRAPGAEALNSSFGDLLRSGVANWPRCAPCCCACAAGEGQGGLAHMLSTHSRVVRQDALRGKDPEDAMARSSTTQRVVGVHGI